MSFGNSIRTVAGTSKALAIGSSVECEGHSFKVDGATQPKTAQEIVNATRTAAKPIAVKCPKDSPAVSVGHGITVRLASVTMSGTTLAELLETHIAETTPAPLAVKPEEEKPETASEATSGTPHKNGRGRKGKGDEAQPETEPAVA